MAKKIAKRLSNKTPPETKPPNIKPALAESCWTCMYLMKDRAYCSRFSYDLKQEAYDVDSICDNWEFHG